MQKDVANEAKKQRVLLGKTTTFKLDPVKMDATTDLESNIRKYRRRHLITKRTSNMLMLMLNRLYDKEPKELQPLLTKSLGKNPDGCPKKEEVEIKPKINKSF